MSNLPDDERELLDWLYGTQLFGVKLGLDSTRRLLSAFDLLHPRARILHVAGTTGTRIPPFSNSRLPPR